MAFGHQMSFTEETDFFKLNQFCLVCIKSDHTQEECALNKPKEIWELGKDTQRRLPENSRRW